MNVERKMSARDKARGKFIRSYRKKQMVNNSVKNTLIMEREHFLDL